MSAFTGRIKSLLVEIDGPVDDLELPEAAALLAELRELRSWLGAVHDHVEDRVADLMGETRRSDVEGVGRLVRFDGRKRTNWRHDDLLDLALAQARKHRFDPSTGEALPPDEALLATLREAAAVSYWRVGPLKKWGIDPDEYATVSHGRRVVNIL